MIIGIDFGTTTSIAAYHDGVGTIIFETADGSLTMPSVVSILDDGEVLVGKPALDDVIENPEFTFQNIKRVLGRKWDALKDQSSQLREGPDGNCHYQGPDRLYAPEELVSMILVEIKTQVERQLRGEVTGAVITVPSSCSDAQRQATIDAATAAGFETVTTLEEPSAAAIAHGLHSKEYKTLAVYDLGGGTFDVSLMKVGFGGYDLIDSLGISERGGVDFDKRIAKAATDAFLIKQGKSVDIIASAQTHIQVRAEETKRSLSTRKVARVRATMIGRDRETAAPLHIDHEMTVADFEELVADYIDETIDVVRRCLEKNDWPISLVDEVVLVGGMTRVPAIQRAVADLFGREPIQGNPDTIVANGAAIKAAMDDERINKTFDTSTQASIGIQTHKHTMMVLIPRGSPLTEEKRFTLTNYFDYQEVLRLRILRGDEVEASRNELIESYDIPIEPGKAGSASVAFSVGFDERGNITTEVEG